MEELENVEWAEDAEEYKKFVDKFKPKRTTDDCFTPPEIYDIVLNWCIKKYKLKGYKIIRPFYPNGDYTKVDYSGKCVVIDNPPFSIISEITRYYNERKIKYFLFAPHLTLFNVAGGESKYIVTSATIVYENGAKVSTSFVTSFGKYKVQTEPELTRLLTEKQNLTKTIKRDYPVNVLSATWMSKIKYKDFKVMDVVKCRKLDNQKSREGIYGMGFLISTAKGEELRRLRKEVDEENRINEKVTLSKREREIVKGLRD